MGNSPALGCSELLLSLSGVSPRRGFLSLWLSSVREPAPSCPASWLFGLGARARLSPRVVKAGPAGLRGRAEQLCQPWPSSQAGRQQGPEEGRKDHL